MELKTLCELNGASGNEGAVRKFVMEAAKPLCDSVKIDRMLREKGLSIHDVKTRVGIIRGKRVGDRLDSEQAFLDFADSLVFLAEQSMVDKCTETTQGAIFLLESKYGYRKGTDLNITANADVVKTVRKWGQETEKPAEAESEAV